MPVLWTILWFGVSFKLQFWIPHNPLTLYRNRGRRGRKDLHSLYNRVNWNLAGKISSRQWQVGAEMVTRPLLHHLLRAEVPDGTTWAGAPTAPAPAGTHQMPPCPHGLLGLPYTPGTCWQLQWKNARLCNGTCKGWTAWCHCHLPTASKMKKQTGISLALSRI